MVFILHLLWKRIFRLSFFRAMCPSCHPTNSVGALKITLHWTWKWQWFYWHTCRSIQYMQTLKNHNDKTVTHHNKGYDKLHSWWDSGMVIWGEVQICIWLSWCHCHSLSFASVNPDWFTFLVFGRPYYRSCLWYSVSSVVCLSVCRLSVVCLWRFVLWQNGAS